MSKIIIYSLLPRLWGNDCLEPKPWGSYEENGSGKLSDLDEQALAYIRSLGATHLWCIGLLEHATATAWPGIPADAPDMVKGIAGSPYALRDYYDIAPSLADDVSRRMPEFEALLERVHRSGLKLLIDFIPNHVARSYHSDAHPAGVVDLGADDDTTKHFDNQNNFYYFPGEVLHLPQGRIWEESPAKATGNDCFSAYPSQNDWYETIKLNYGVDYLGGGHHHFAPIPKTWIRMLEILDFWASKGVDGFRCDMAEMVPEAFWSWAIPQLKERYGADLCFLAEIYQSHRYASYLHAGFDYLYDKVGVYDTLRAIMRGECSASAFDAARDAVADNQSAMCYFLENHDEQRIASDFFASSPLLGIPALGASLLSGGNPYLLYFGQELGEPGMQAEGFSGVDGRTTIFDYWSLGCIQRLRADYLGGELTEQERHILESYQQILAIAQSEPLVSSGAYYGLNFVQGTGYDTDRCLSYLRYADGAYLLVVANFSHEARVLTISLPEFVLEHISLPSNTPLRSEDLRTGACGITTLTPYAPWQLTIEGYGLKFIKLTRLQD
ncbi:MAG: alpha-amylase family glycosyl hydrolase [Porphyromonadaceae bacterium]|nr:alpha-amylase family glycosyl hydrolase [Porphyromonadaceae bacterium]